MVMRNALAEDGFAIFGQRMGKGVALNPTTSAN